MADQAKNILIGIFVITACAIIFLVLLFLHPTVGDEGQTLRVRFADIDKITLGTRVTYGGKPVGEVVAIEPIKDSPENVRKPYEGYVYLYELLLRVDSSVKVYNTDTIASRTSGLLGEKSIEISPQPLLPNEKLEIVNKNILYAYESGSVEETLKEVKRIAEKFNVTLEGIKIAVNDFNQRKVIEKVDKTMQHLASITRALDNPKQLAETFTNFNTTSKNFSSMSKNADAFSAKLNDSWPKIELALDKLDYSLDHFKLVAAEMSGGRGTAGKIFMNDDLYLRLTSILSKGETLFDDINHYGLLFQNDKHWQRLRARRANLIYKLNSPQEFRNYFNDEVDQIITSLARVTMVVEETECSPQFQEFIDDDEFRKVFAELIRRVKSMEDSLKNYNQQLVERETQKMELICY